MRRWIGRWPDRRLAAAVVLVAAVVMGVLVVTTTAPEPPLAQRDPVATHQLVVLMARGEGVDRIVDYTFTRSRSPAKQSLSYDTTEARFGRAQVTRASGVVTVKLPAVTYVCETVDDTPSCATQPPDRSLPASEVTGVAIGIGAYDAVRVGDASIAGERARCFRVRARSAQHLVRGLGRQSTLCLAKDGIPLRIRVEGDTTDEYRADHVNRKVDQGVIVALLKGFDQPANAVRR